MEVALSRGNREKGTRNQETGAAAGGCGQQIINPSERLFADRTSKFMKNTLNGKKVAILVTEGFEQVELTEPKAALEKAGAETEIVSPAGATVRAWAETDGGKKFTVDVPLKKAKADDYDALLLPGGVMNPDKLRMDPKAVEFVRAFAD